MYYMLFSQDPSDIYRVFRELREFSRDLLEFSVRFPESGDGAHGIRIPEAPVEANEEGVGEDVVIEEEVVEEEGMGEAVGEEVVEEVEEDGIVRQE